MKIISVMLLLTVLLSVNGLVRAQAVPSEETVRNELRALRADLLSAIASGDVDKLLNHIHPNVVVTWQNHEVSRGHQGLKDFMNRMGKETFKSYKMPPTPDEPTILYGDTGLSFGRTVAQYKILGKELEVTSRWTATLVKEKGRWLLAGYHVSANALDNPLLNGAKNALYWVGGVAILLGLLIGWIIGMRRRAGHA